VKTAKAALRAKFIAYEIAADFVADLCAERDAITTAINVTNQNPGAPTGKTGATFINLYYKVIRPTLFARSCVLSLERFAIL
jgi:hypothetical protein